jgi:hypothetical protein
MATQEETQDALLDTIHRLASTDTMNESNSRSILNLAESWAWLSAPAQSHGSGHHSSP